MSSGLEWGVGDNLDSGNKYCKQEGWYHVLIEKCSIPGRKEDGNLIDGSIGKFSAIILGGTNESQREKECTLTYFKPNLSHKDQGKFSREKFDRFLLACGVIKKDAIGATLTLSEANFVGSQLIIHWVSRRDAQNKEQWDVAGKDVYHVDDPEVSHVPKYLPALKLIAPDRRWTEKPETKPIIPPPPEATESDDAGI